MQLLIQRYFSLFLTYLQRLWRHAFMMSICLLVGTGLQLLNPQILKYFIDSATNHGPTEALPGAGLLFLAIVLLNQGVAVATTYLSNYISWTATNQIRADLVEHCLSLDMSFHKEHTSGEMIERIDGDVDACSNFFSQFVVHLLGNTLLLVGGLLLLFTIHWIAGLTMTIFSIIAMVILIYIRRRAMPLWLARRQTTATFFGFLSERLSGTDDIRANGATSYSMRRFLLLLRQFASIWRKAGMAEHIMGLTTTFVFICGNALAISVGIYLWNARAITLGTAYAIYAYTNLLTQPIERLQDQLQDWQQAEACIQRIEQLWHIPHKLIDGKGTPLPEHTLSIDLEEVSFGYTDDVLVLKNLSFRLESGKVLGVLGRTGSGKTTLARLLFRLYDPQQGEIRIGGVPLKDTKIHEMRQHIGMVTQEVQLFHATVRDNLTFFNQSIPDNQILAAIDEAGLSSWLQAFPEGLDTMLGSDGTGISAGEAQLLAFMRVLLTNPGLVILDEASARLDAATEHRIERAIDKLLRGRTAIVIAHRLATVQRVDEILIIDNGKVLEHGNRDTLASDPDSHFAHLLQTGLEGVLA